MSKIKKQVSKHVVYDENNLAVTLEVDYSDKSFKITSSRRDGIFLFHSKDILRIRAIAQLIIDATFHADQELNLYPTGYQTQKETIEAFTQ